MQKELPSQPLLPVLSHGWLSKKRMGRTWSSAMNGWCDFGLITKSLTAGVPDLSPVLDYLQDTPKLNVHGLWPHCCGVICHTQLGSLSVCKTYSIEFLGIHLTV